MAQLRRFLCQEDEDGLSHFLGLMRVANGAQWHGINQIDVPRYQSRKGIVGMAFRILP